MHQLTRFLALSQVEIRRPLPSVFLPFSWKMCSAHSTESNEKTIFGFLFSELWLIVFTMYQKFTYQKKSCQKVTKFTKNSQIALKNDILVPEFLMSTFIFWDMVDFDT